jgi:phage shock protein A
MIRYSSAKVQTSIEHAYEDLLETAYHELLELRERVRRAEAAAVKRARLSSRPARIRRNATVRRIWPRR